MQNPLQAIENLVDDDFCEDIAYVLAVRPDSMSEREREMAQRLLHIYRIAHSHNSHSCYTSHEDWRTEEVH